MLPTNEMFYNRYNQYIDSLGVDPILDQSLKYCFNSNGKLFRPMLMWSMLKDLENDDQAMDVALAIEMIHTYSLVHDDLPAMDDDDYRRGKLTTHKVYGEDIAILTGDALLTQAFDLVANSGYQPSQIVELIQAITSASGATGMIGGQVLDVKNENDPNLSQTTLEVIHDKKTAMMIELPIKCAFILSSVTEPTCLAAARKLGLFYQIQDDYLDTYGDFDKIGKATNADVNKVTYTSFYSKLELEAYIEQLGNEILMAYDKYPTTKGLIKTIIQREG